MIGLLANPRLLRLFSGAVIDQAMLSAASLVVGLLLIRHTSDSDYGHFVLAQSALLLLVSLQGAFINGPLAVLAPKKDPAIKRDMVGALYGFQRRLSMLIGLGGFALVALVGATGLLPWPSVAVCAAFVFAAWLTLNREYLRQILLIYSRPHRVLQADAVYVVFLVGIAAVAAYFTTPAAPVAVAGIAIAAWLGSLVSSASIAGDPGFSNVDYKRFLAEIKPLGVWATGGAAIYWTFSQGYNYLLALKLDVAAVAAVAATRLLLMPVNLLTGGIKQLLLPTASNWYRHNGFGGLLRRLVVFIVAASSVAVCYCGLLWFSRDWITTYVLKKTILGRDTLILIWMAIFLIAMVRDLLMTALYVRERFSSLTWLALPCAIVALGVGTVLMGIYGPRGALFGLLVGEAVNLCGISVLIWRESRRSGV